MAHTRLRAILATAILRDDHRKVKELFAQYDRIGEEALADPRLDLFLEIKKELTIHAEIEEERFYPAIESLRDRGEEAGELVREARADHHAVKALLDELSDLPPEDEEFDSRMRSMMEIVTEHADKEEEEIFPLFNELSRERQMQVSEELRVRRAELIEEYDEE